VTGISKATAASTRDLWTEEGDEFFGHSGPPQPGPQDPGKEVEEGTGMPKPARGGKRHRSGGTTGSRSRKSTASTKDRSRRKPVIESGNVSSTLQ